MDALVFSGGIGENAVIIRERICAGLDFLGISLDSTLNQANAPLISSTTASTAIHVIPTNEEAVIAAALASLLQHKDSL